MKSLEEYLQQATKGGSIRSGMILGIRLSLVGLKRLGSNRSPEDRRSLLAIVETDRCLPDAVQLVTGCRLGNRTLKLKDLGKMASTFVDLETKVAVRVAAREIPGLSGGAARAHLQSEHVLSKAYRLLSDEELFSQQNGKVELSPAEIPGFRVPRVICVECGEGVGFNREIMQDRLVFCRSCAGDRYFEPLEPAR